MNHINSSVFALLAGLMMAIVLVACSGDPEETNEGAGTPSAVAVTSPPIPVPTSASTPVPATAPLAVDARVSIPPTSIPTAAITPRAETPTSEATSNQTVSLAPLFDRTPLPGWNVFITRTLVPKELDIFELVLAVLPVEERMCVDSALMRETPLPVADIYYYGTLPTEAGEQILRDESLTWLEKLSALQEFGTDRWSIFFAWREALPETGCLSAPSFKLLSDIGPEWLNIFLHLPDDEALCLVAADPFEHWDPTFYFLTAPAPLECIGDQSLVRLIMGAKFQDVEFDPVTQQCISGLLEDENLVREAAKKIHPVVVEEPDYIRREWIDLDSWNKLLMFFALIPLFQCMSPEVLAEYDYDGVDNLACVLEAVGPEALAEAFTENAARPDLQADVQAAVDGCYSPSGSADSATKTVPQTTAATVPPAATTQASTPSADPPNRGEIYRFLIRMDPDDMVRISITHAGVTASFEDTGNGWVIKDGNDTPVHNEAWSGTPLLFSSLRANFIAPSVDDPSKYGLDEPQTTVTLTDRHGAQFSYIMGNPTPDGEDWYIAYEGGLYTMPAFWCEFVSNKVFDLPYPP